MFISELRRLLDRYRPLFLGLSFLIFYLRAAAQTYNPSVCCTVSNKAYGAAQAVPTDGRSQFYDATNLVMRDYNGTTEVFSYLNLTKYRTGHFPIYVHSGGLLQGNGVWLGGSTLVYWFKDSTGNANLVRWYTDSTGTPGGPFFAVANNLSEGNAGLIKGNLTLDLVDNTSDAQKNAAAVSLTNHTIDANSNTLLNIPNSALTNSSIGLTLNNTGATPQVTTTPAALGSSLVLAVPWANGSDSGFLRGTDWSFFNGKLDSVRISNDSVYNCVNGTCTLQSVIAGTGGVNSVNGTNASLLFSPTTGNVLGQVNPAFTFNWTGQHTFTSFAPIFSTLTTAGGVFYGDGFGQLLQSGAGTSGQIFQSNGGTAPTFFTPDATTVSNWLGYTPLTAALGSSQIFVGNGSNVATAVNISQDVSMANTGAATVVGLRGRSIASTAPTNGQAYTYNTGGAQWEPHTLLGSIFSKSLILPVSGTDTVSFDSTLLKAPEQDYGLLYSRYNGNFNASNWISVGNAVATSSGGNLALSSLNSGTAANYVYLTNYTDSLSQLNQDSVNIAFKITGLGTGIGPGIKTANVRGLSGDYFAFINTTSSPCQIQLLYAPGGSGASLAGPIAGPAFSVNDSLEVNVWFADSVLKANVRNVTTGSSTTNISFNYSLASGPLLPVVARHVIYTLGGTQTVYKYNFYSKTVKYPNILFAGDSKTDGYRASFFKTRYGSLVGTPFPTSVIWAGGDDETIDIGAAIQQIIALSPYQVFLHVGSNDLRYGRTVAQTFKTYDSVHSILTSHNIKVWDFVTPEDSTVATPAANGLTALKNMIQAAYPVSYIDVYAPMSTGNVLLPAFDAGDGIHLNQAGNTLVADTLISQAGLRTNQGRACQICNVDQYLRNTNGLLSVDINSIKRDAGVPLGTTNTIIKYTSTSTLGNSGITDDGTSTITLGNWNSTPLAKIGLSTPVTGSAFTMNTNGSGFTNLHLNLYGGSTNNKIWGFTNNGTNFSADKLTDGGGAGFTWLNVTSSGTTLTSIGLQGRTLLNNAIDDGSTGVIGAGGARFDKMGINTAPVTDSWLIVGAGTTSVSGMRFNVGPNKTTTFGGTVQYATGADTSFFAGITRNNVNVLTRLALVDSGSIKTGRIPFANTSRYYTDDASFTYNTTTGLALTKALSISNVPTGFAASTLLAHMPDSSVAQLPLGSGLGITGGQLMVTTPAIRYAHTIFTPLTGGTVNLINNQYNIVNPAGAIATLTVNLPSSPADGDVVFIKYTQGVTTVTYGNGTVVDGITGPSAGGLVILTFDSGTTSWY